VVYAPPVRQSSYSEAPSEGYIPTVPSDRGGAGRGLHPSPSEAVSNHRAARPAPVVEPPRSSYHEVKAKAEADNYSRRDHERGGGGALVAGGHGGGGARGHNQSESILARCVPLLQLTLTLCCSDFLEGRKAAQAFKARYQQYETNADHGDRIFGGGGGVGGGGGRGGGAGQARDEDDHNGELSAREQVRAKRERERVLEMAEKEKQVSSPFCLLSKSLSSALQLRQAYEETRQAKVRLEEQRKKQNQLGAFGRAGGAAGEVSVISPLDDALLPLSLSLCISLSLSLSVERQDNNPPLRITPLWKTKTNTSPSSKTEIERAIGTEKSGKRERKRRSCGSIKR
jgi:hypothetical protein